MTSRVKRFVLLAAAFALLAVPAAAGAVGGFTSPLFGLATAANGDLLVADAGAGIATVRGNMVRTTIPLPGVAAVSTFGRTGMWAVTGGAEPTEDSGQAIYRITGGNVEYIANLFAVEATDPDGAGVDSNPYAVATLSSKAAVVADAGGNDLMRVTNKGDVHVMALFPDEVVSTANLQDLIDCAGTPIPDFAFICDIPAMPAQAVPTSIAIGPDGSLYVGELKGFPAPSGESGIWHVSPGAREAECGASVDCTLLFDGGFTSIVDLKFGPDGLLYVAELDERSWAAVEFGIGAEGGTISACDVTTLTCDVVAEDIFMLTAITFGNDGTLYATTNSLIPGAAEVIAIP